MKKFLAVLVMLGCVHQASAMLAFTMSAPVFAALNGALGTLNIMNGIRIMSNGDSMIGGIILGLGVVILDEKNQQVVFQPLDEKRSAALGVNPQERSAYNAELPLINLAFDETVRQLTAAWGGGTTGEVNRLAKGFWQQVTADAGISPMALSAVQKLGGTGN